MSKNRKGAPAQYVSLESDSPNSRQPARTASQEAPKTDDRQWTMDNRWAEGKSGTDGMTGMARQIEKAKRLANFRLQNFYSRADEHFYDEGGNFNPRRVANGSRLMNDHGQLQATDRKDAFNQIHSFFHNRELQLKTLNAHVPWKDPSISNQRRASLNQTFEEAGQYDESAKIRKIAQRLSSDSGPIRPLMEFTSWARDILLRKDIKKGEIWKPRKDLGRGRVWMLGQRGGSAKSYAEARARDPEFARLQSIPMIQFWDDWALDYDGMARLSEILREEMSLQEARVVMRVIDAASAAENAPVEAPGKLDVATLERCRQIVESDRMVVEKFLMMRPRLSDFITEISGEVDPVTQRELLMTGVAGHMHGAAIMVANGGGVNGTSGNAVFDPNKVYALGPAENVGYLGIAQEVTVRPIDELQMGLNSQGLFGHSMIAPVVMEPKNIARIDIVS